MDITAVSSISSQFRHYLIANSRLIKPKPYLRIQNIQIGSNLFSKVLIGLQNKKMAQERGLWFKKIEEKLTSIDWLKPDTLAWFNN
jgi:hypothetical protein